MVTSFGATSGRDPVAGDVQLERGVDGGTDGNGEGNESDGMVSERETEPIRRVLAEAYERGIFRLREQHNSRVVPEVLVAEFRVAVEAETAEHQRVEVSGEEISEVVMQVL